MGTKSPTENTTSKHTRLNVGMCSLMRIGSGRTRMKRSEKMFSAAWLKYSAVRSKQCHSSRMVKIIGSKTRDGLWGHSKALTRIMTKLYVATKAIDA